MDPASWIAVRAAKYSSSSQSSADRDSMREMGCRPLVAVVVELTVSELATIDESDDDRRRGMYARVAEFLCRQKRAMPSVLTEHRLLMSSPWFTPSKAGFDLVCDPAHHRNSVAHVELGPNANLRPAGLVRLRRDVDLLRLGLDWAVSVGIMLPPPPAAVLPAWVLLISPRPSSGRYAARRVH